MFSWLTYVLIPGLLAGNAIALPGDRVPVCETKCVAIAGTPPTVCLTTPSGDTCKAECIVIKQAGGKPAKACADKCIVRTDCKPATACANKCLVKAADSAKPRVVVCSPGGATLTADTLEFSAGAAGRPMAMLCADGNALLEFKAPPFWIGIRGTPVPEALAAHIGEEGVVIINICEDSPAEDAGLQRFDVIREFNGRTVNTLDELIEAITDNEDGQASLRVIRESQPVKVQLTPTKRAQGQAVIWKFDEADESKLEDTYDIRGLQLHRLPSGDFTLKELGELENLPEMLEELKVEIPNIALDLPPHYRFAVPRPPTAPVPGDAPVDFFVHSDEAEHQALTIKIVNEDGSLSIQAEGDDHILVERVDADGNGTTTLYDNEDEFRKSDPEAYQHYRKFHGGRRWHISQPARQQIDDARRKFEVQLRTQISDAQEHADEARQRANEAREQFNKAQEQVQRVIRKKIIEKSGAAGGAVKETLVETMMIMVDADSGAIKVVIDRGEGKVTYEFANEEAFESQEPELYQKYLKHRD